MIQPQEPLDPASFRGVLDLVLGELRERIVTGEFQPGTPLRQRDLASELGVSREPIKQAMRILATEGLVVWPPRRSAMVAPLTKKAVKDVYEVRAALDAVAARRAAQLEPAARTDLCEQLGALVREAGKPPAGGRRRLTDLDKQFHLLIYEAAGNEVATAVYHARWIVIVRAMSLVATTQYTKRAWKEHGEIQTAIARGEAEVAARLAEAHGHGAAEWLLTNVRELGGDEPSATPDEGG